MRDRRERENRRIAAERERQSEAKRVRIAEQRLRGGSRFNLRYDDRVPDGIRPQAERAFGRPTATSKNIEGTLVLTTASFDVGDQRITADFVEDVLVRYTVSSK